ncbi:UNVERIFIED_CONTAM: hypothetical protein FKN15_036358 [Acipenser sinensis]
MDLDEVLKDITRRERRRRSMRYSRQLDTKPFIAARFRTLPSHFILGDQMEHNGYENRALEPGQEYVFFILAVLDNPEVKMFAASPYTDPVMAPDLDPQPVDGGDGLIWVVGPVLAVVFIICIVIAILLYKK